MEQTSTGNQLKRTSVQLVSVVQPMRYSGHRNRRRTKMNLGRFRGLVVYFMPAPPVVQ